MATRSYAQDQERRLRAAIIIVMSLAVLLAIRLAIIQGVQAHALNADALEQQAKVVPTFAKRGMILDRDGTVLARSLPSQSVYANPSEIGSSAADDAAVLAPILGYPQARIAAALSEPTQFRYLKRKVSQDVANRVKALKLVGIYLQPEETGARYYPAGHLASTVLGYVGGDENGLGGVEYSFDDLLRGVPGQVSFPADVSGHAIPFDDARTISKAIPGRTVQLTIDSFDQFEAERLLRDEVAKSAALSGTVIVMDVHTGEILADANMPDFDPGQYGAVNSDHWRDRALTDAYEPGSTFKLITAAAGLESGKIKPDDRVPALDVINVAGSLIRNAADGNMAGGHGTESIEDVIAYSHNVGAAEIGMRIGEQDLYRTIRAFGFGNDTNVETPGENAGIVRKPADWSGTSLANIAFGQGISVEPLALARAYAAIANGGLLLRPRVVHAIYDADNHLVYSYPTEVERRVISESTAATLRRYLHAVVARGTGNPSAHVPGYDVAGKTGTAQMVVGGTYGSGAYIPSFIGIVPADAPKYVILVKVVRPRGLYYGSEVAAPVFAKLASAIMLHDGVLPAATPAPVDKSVYNVHASTNTPKTSAIRQ